MKILSIQGNFGNLGGKRVEFGEGFTSSVLPNGWGKTTLCALLRVMFYGLNTGKRDTQDALSDKTHYLPQDGKPMAGRLRVRFGERVIVISRATGKGGLMQEFDAFYEDTDEKCTFLHAKNCGETLLGMGEDGFLSSVFIDGAVLARPSEELRERMLEMAQTGDAQGRATEALRTMERWRLDLDSGNGHGVLPRAQGELAQLQDVLRQLDAAQTRIDEQQARADALAGEEQAASAAYDAAYRAYAARSVGGGARLDALIEESGDLVRALSARTPPELMLRTAEEALYGYEGAKHAEKEKRERLPGGRTRYEQALANLEDDRRDYEIEQHKAAQPRVRWIPLLLALLLACASAATFLLDIDWGAYTEYVPWALSGLSVLGLITAFWGCVPKNELPPRDFDEERQALLRQYGGAEAAQDVASGVLQDACDALLHAAQALCPAVTDVEEAAQTVRQAQSDAQALRREQAALGELLRQRKNLPEDEAKSTEVDARRAELAAARERADAARQMLAQLQGRAQALGARDKIEAECERFARASEDAARRHAAVCTALEELKGAQAELSARISPQITAKTCEYMEFLTCGAYCEVRLDAALTARCAGADGRLLDGLRLSAGTRDVLYFALRLAVSEVLGAAEEPAPLILDDPFLTFDDTRTARATELLHRLAQERQVILFSCRAFGGS